jgi:hypothetical protein
VLVVLLYSYLLASRRQYCVPMNSRTIPEATLQALRSMMERHASMYNSIIWFVSFHWHSPPTRLGNIAIHSNTANRIATALPSGHGADHGYSMRRLCVSIGTRARGHSEQCQSTVCHHGMCDEARVRPDTGTADCPTNSTTASIGIVANGKLAVAMIDCLMHPVATVPLALVACTSVSYVPHL